MAVLEHFWVLVVNQGCEITAIVEDQIEVLAVFES